MRNKLQAKSGMQIRKLIPKSKNISYLNGFYSFPSSKVNNALSKIIVKIHNGRLEIRMAIRHWYQVFAFY
jgi:hypothetical protein